MTSDRSDCLVPRHEPRISSKGGAAVVAGNTQRGLCRTYCRRTCVAAVRHTHVLHTYHAPLPVFGGPLYWTKHNQERLLT